MARHHFFGVVVALAAEEALVDLEILLLVLPNYHDAPPFHLLLQAVAYLHHLLVEDGEGFAVLDEGYSSCRICASCGRFRIKLIGFVVLNIRQVLRIISLSANILAYLSSLIRCLVHREDL